MSDASKKREPDAQGQQRGALGEPQSVSRPINAASNNSHRQGLDADDDFVTGNFSAKYYTKRQPADVATAESVKTVASSIGQEPTDQPAPITLEGFETTTPSSSLRVLHSHTSTQPSTQGQQQQSQQTAAQHLRRPSGLSNLMSGTIVGTSPVIGSSEGSIVNADASSGNNNDILNNPSNDVVNTVNRHLVRDTDSSLMPLKSDNSSNSQGNDMANDHSLQLQGGDVTRDLYNWVNKHDRKKRASSFSEFGSVHNDEGNSSNFLFDDVGSANELRAPGGFRRDFIRQKGPARPQDFLTRNFIEFIAIYGHFAGEEIEDEDDEDDDDDAVDFDEEMGIEDVEDISEDDEHRPDERQRLMQDRYNSFNSMDNKLVRQNLLMRGKAPLSLQNPQALQLIQQRRKAHMKARRSESAHLTSNLKSFLLLLKAFLGTGVLFLPKSFGNGGLVYSNLMIIIFSILSYYCFVTLIKIRSTLNVSSYGNLGLALYGGALKKVILLSIVLSQIGFSAAYIVFVATNFSQLCDGQFTVRTMILLQLIVFIPMSLIRRLSKLSFVVLISDLFILLGLIYVYYYSTYNIMNKGGIDWDNLTLWVDRDTWSLFIGTAIFTYEGIGLLIPIHESMKEPEKFDKLLIMVMCIITVIFISLGSIAYLSFGNDVKTVILLNFEHSEFVQFLYSLAILLSTPLQLFPGIKMIELICFKDTRRSRGKKAADTNIDESIDAIRSGKEDPNVKLQKNLLRIVVVIGTVIISIVGSNDLDKFVSLIGSFTCVPLIYIFPPLLNMKLSTVNSVQVEDFNIRINTDDGTTSPDEKKNNWDLKDAAMLTLGVIMMVYTSISTLHSWIK